MLECNDAETDNVLHGNFSPFENHDSPIKHNNLPVENNTSPTEFSM